MSLNALVSELFGFCIFWLLLLGSLFFCFSFLSVSLVAFSLFLLLLLLPFFTCPLVLFVSIPDGLAHFFPLLSVLVPAVW